MQVFYRYKTLLEQNIDELAALATLVTGVPVFERKSNPVAFTTCGQRLLRMADAVLAVKEDW